MWRDKARARGYQRREMNLLRAFVRDYRVLAMCVMALTLCVKVAVPQGFMPGSGQQILSVQVCLDGITHKSVDMLVQTDGSAPGKRTAADGPCAFTALSMDAMAHVDAVLLGAAIAFILALGFAPARVVLRGLLPHARPPLRGPPLPT